MVTINLEAIIDKALNRNTLSKEEIKFLLKLSDPLMKEKVFLTARELRNRYFQDRVFLYGFIYFSTYCRNDCSFCYYRKSNNLCRRYRKTAAEVADIARALAESGVYLIDLTMGEDPLYLSDSTEGQEKLLEIVRMVKESTGLPVMISPGVVAAGMLKKLKEAGADWYACYQETHNRRLYKKLRLNQSYNERWAIKVYAKTIGMLVEEGLLVGVGDSIDDIVNSLMEMKSLGAEQVRTMTFVPQQGTPLYGIDAPGDALELNIIAVMRILFPDRLIPASLDVKGIFGLKERLDAGANVVTSLIPPERGLVGVSQSTLDISEGHRTVKGIMPALQSCGLKPATLAEYTKWIKEKQGHPIKIDKRKEMLCW
ncbi:Radical SAM domain protein [Desulfofarcimen acetoxidans DSM 771]|jgi:methylornithine synthase|uniref:Radical SAM domain protein n=1 Tax=Desulfofarcimen acetoxidans (strain ATCC 49208 / DSM 771 / KCTC 5769 / VKM B-1644 / 5575) TaxID=485916 RepID=C8VVC9_DESAS|nr:methylornithine synthase PylB [Desulfofarcimen acetoxidans]ACV60992.1 Radical SAM domain protein [Desulfofarcimen acetoxidans DSM 771]